jgi:hypothetical protein
MQTIKDHLGGVILSASGFLGIIFIVVPLWFGWEADHGIMVAIGTSLLIAPIVAVGIERWMIQSIARDVFHAAFGYSFPADFKAEIGRIVNHGIICTRHIMDVKLRAFDSESMLVIVTAERHFKNISSSDQSHAGSIWIDEWGFSEPSKIIRCEIFDQDGTPVSHFDPSQIVYKDNLSFEATTSRITLKPNGRCSTIIEYSVLRRRNDLIYEQFSAPTRNPEIRIIEIPDDIEATADFGGGRDKVVHIPYRYELDGVYFAPAPMKVRWWPKSQSERWPPTAPRSPAAQGLD